ncbi:hypothetical protein V6C27_07240 [Peptococcaceae bacterium 1198_IL3148]
MNCRRFLTAFIALLIIILPNIALADTVLTVTPGLNGLYKTDQPVQLNISIANNGAAVENAVLMVKQNRESLGYTPAGSAVYQKTVDLPANQRVETQIVIPGEMANNNALVYLYANDTELARAKVQGVAVNDFIGLSVGETPLANGLPIWLETNMKNMLTLKYMAPTEVPDNPIALGAADFIVMDDQSIGALSSQQLTTIHHWVTLGGTLLLSGGAGAAEGQAFADISPVLVTGNKNITGNWNGLRTATNAVAVTTGTFVDGEKLLTVDGTTLVARRTIGRGDVVYSAVGLENLQAKDNKVWEALLKMHDAPIMAAKHGNDRDINISLLDASANFPQLHPPSITYLVGIWGLYMVLVAPGLYLLLKKYNRRDWAWLGVPMLAVLTAAVIYYSAPMHKLNGPLGQTLAMVEVVDEQVAEIKADGSYVSPKGGELMLADTDQGLITPRVRYNGDNWGQLPIIDYSNQQIGVNYGKVGYLSLRQASLYKVVNDFGYIKGEVKLEGSKITGQLINQTNIDIEKCILIFGDNVVELGELPTNGSINVDEDVMTAKRFNWETDLQDWFGTNTEALYQIRDAVATKEYVVETEADKGIQLVALAKQVPGLMQLKNADAENISTAMIKQQIPLVLPDSGKFRLPAGFIPANIVESNGGLEQTPEGYMIHGGHVTVEFNLQLPVQQQVEVQAVEISNLLVASNYQLSIFDWTNASWVPIEPNRGRLAGNDLKPYISEQNRLRINIEKSDYYDVMPLPGLAVEGVVK